MYMVSQHSLLVVKQIIFNTVIDVRYFADVKLATSQFEILLQLCPPIDHQINGLIMVQWSYGTADKATKCFTTRVHVQVPGFVWIVLCSSSHKLMICL